MPRIPTVSTCPDNECAASLIIVLHKQHILPRIERNEHDIYVTLFVYPPNLL